VIHAASDEADHAHSGWVVTPTVVVSPFELTAEVGTASVTAHFEGEGPVDVATVEPQAPTTQDSTDSNRKVSCLAVTALYIGSLPRG